MPLALILRVCVYLLKCSYVQRFFYPGASAILTVGSLYGQKTIYMKKPPCYIKTRNIADLSMDKGRCCYLDEGNLQVTESKIYTTIIAVRVKKLTKYEVDNRADICIH